MGKGKRTKAQRRAEEAAREQRRPPAPVVEWVFRYVCAACRKVADETIGRGPEVNLQIPGRCPSCGCSKMEIAPAANILNGEDYPNGIEGIEFQVRDEPGAKPSWRFVSQDKVYRETGERFRYQRVFDRGRNLYSKRYTNLDTGQVEVEESEPLTEHTGRGAARPKREPDTLTDS